MRRNIVVVGHRATTGPSFNLKDVPGTSGRLDVMMRCLTQSFLTSHGLREDTTLYLILLGPPMAPKTLRITGARLKNLNPDERTTAMLLQRVLAVTPTGPVWREAGPGIEVAALDLEGLVDEFEGAQKIVLEESGADVEAVPLGEDVVLFVGDDQGFTDEERALLKKWGATPVNLGPMRLHADQAIVVAHNVMDRRSG